MPERYVADENFPRLAFNALRAAGFDVVHIGDLDPGAPDEDVAEEASRRDAILLTFDLDFGDLTIRRRVAVAGVVLFRLGQQPPDVVLGFVEAFFATRPLLRGRFTVASPGRVRQRPLAAEPRDRR